MQFQWDEGNMAKFEKILGSGRIFTVDETESVFNDPHRLIETSYPDEYTKEARYKITGASNQNRVICVIFVIRAGTIRIFNVWKAKQTVLNNYHAQKTDPRTEESAHGEANADD